MKNAQSREIFARSILRLLVLASLWLSGCASPSSRTIHTSASELRMGSGRRWEVQVPDQVTVDRLNPTTLQVSFPVESLRTVFVEGDLDYGYNVKVNAFLLIHGKRTPVVGEIGRLDYMTFFVHNRSHLPIRADATYTMEVVVSITRTVHPISQGWQWANELTESDLPVVTFRVSGV